jgi:hypothetical protein
VTDPAGQWLIRTADNLVAGPYSRDQVCQLIRDGQLGLQDEVCPANGYWIFLHEREEVKKFLAIEVPKAAGAGGDEEDTETEIAKSDRTDPGVARPAPVAARSAEEGVPLPELAPQPTVTQEEQTAMLSNAALKRFQPKKAAPQKAASPQLKLQRPTAGGVAVAQRSPLPGIPPLSQVERPSFWKGFAWLLVAGVALVIYAVLRIIRLS